MPDDDPGKWNEFKTYAEYDVIAERDIVEQLDQFPFPEFERRNYLVDQSINDRGILIDLDMAGNAISFDEVYTEEMTDRMKELTGLDNPNSLAQLKTWLSTNFGLNFPALGKPEILEYLKTIRRLPIWSRRSSLVGLHCPRLQLRSTLQCSTALPKTGELTGYSSFTGPTEQDVGRAE